MLGLIISGICTQGAHEDSTSSEMAIHTAAAVAEGLLDAGIFAPASDIVSHVSAALHKWKAMYRCSFEPGLAPAYASVAGLLYGSVERTRAAAAAAARALGCVGTDTCACEAAASAVYIARTCASKEAIKEYAEREFTPLFSGDETNGTEACTTPCAAIKGALTAFLESEDFRSALSECAGGSCTGSTALAGELAEAFYGLPAYLAGEARRRMPGEVLDVADRLYAAGGRDGYCDPAAEKREAAELDGNAAVAEAIDRYNKHPKDVQLFADVLEALRFQMHRGKSLVWSAEYGELPDSIPSCMSVGDLMAGGVKPEKRLSVYTYDDRKWYVAFTDQKLCDMWGHPQHTLSLTRGISTIKEILKEMDGTDGISGIIINPGDNSFCLMKEVISEILRFEIDMYWHVPENNGTDEEAPGVEKYREELIRFYADRQDIFAGNRDIVHAALLLKAQDDFESFKYFVAMIKRQIRMCRAFIIPTKEAPEDMENNIGYAPFTASQLREKILSLDSAEGKEVLPVYTDAKQYHGEDATGTVLYPIFELFRCATEWKDDFVIILNPHHPLASFQLTQEDIKNILDMLAQEDQRERDRQDGKFPEVSLCVADITKMKDVDVIVNCANNALSAKGGGINEAVHEAAGPKLEKECMRLGGCETGMAKLTFAYNLPCKAVIHTVGPLWQGGGCREEEYLRLCYVNALRLAASNGLTRIALPAISAGCNGFPVRKAAKAAVDAVRRFITNGGYLHFNSIKWVFADKDTFDTYFEEMKKTFE